MAILNSSVENIFNDKKIKVNINEEGKAKRILKYMSLKKYVK